MDEAFHSFSGGALLLTSNRHQVETFNPAPFCTREWACSAVEVGPSLLGRATSQGTIDIRALVCSRVSCRARNLCADSNNARNPTISVWVLAPYLSTHKDIYLNHSRMGWRSSDFFLLRTPRTVVETIISHEIF